VTEIKITISYAEGDKMKIVKTASGKRTIKISKKEWKSIGDKAGWTKEAQNNTVKWFDWEDLNSAEVWTIQYRDLPANELDQSYDKNGTGHSENEIMSRMIESIERKSSGEKLVDRLNAIDDRLYEIEQELYDIKKEEVFIKQK